MGAHLISFIIFTLFSCIILTNQSLPWYSLQSGFQCDTKMAAVFSCMRPTTMRSVVQCSISPSGCKPSSVSEICLILPTYTGPLVFKCEFFYNCTIMKRKAQESLESQESADAIFTIVG